MVSEERNKKIDEFLDKSEKLLLECIKSFKNPKEAEKRWQASRKKKS